MPIAHPCKPVGMALFWRRTPARETRRGFFCTNAPLGDRGGPIGHGHIGATPRSAAQTGHQRAGEHHMDRAVRVRLAQLKRPVLGRAIGTRQADLQFPGTGCSWAGVIHRQRKGLPQKSRVLLRTMHRNGSQDAAIRADHIVPSGMRVAGASAALRVLLERAHFRRLVEAGGHEVNL